ncbi:MAG: amino acid ABC transporter permease [Calditerrivibrio sp.]|nr:amino acid ABC transporter permease [Calditerrivibrio sp.]
MMISINRNLGLRILSYLILIFSLYFLTTLVDYKWDWYRIPRLLGYFEYGRFISGELLKGFFKTIEIAFLSIFSALMVGSFAAILSFSPLSSLQIIYKAYIFSFRNTPLIIQILINYFIVGHIYNLSAYWVAVGTLALFEGSYVAEILRGGFGGISKEQWLAGYSLGLSRCQVFGRVILPQTVPVVLPPLGNIVVSTVKDSSLLSVISIYELTFEAQKAVSESFLTFEIWWTVAVLYFIINIIITILVRFLEIKSMRWKR